MKSSEATINLIKPVRQEIVATRLPSLQLQRTSRAGTPDLVLWSIIRNSCSLLQFNRYKQFIDEVLCVGELKPNQDVFGLRNTRLAGFSGGDRYNLLKVATEVYVMANCGVDLGNLGFSEIAREAGDNLARAGSPADPSVLSAYWSRYQSQVLKGFQLDGTAQGKATTLPYLGLIREKLKDAALFDHQDHQLTSACLGIIQDKLTHPCMMELIWSYWHEEGMLVQTLNAITLRFQNIQGAQPGRDPLATMEIDPLRPLNSMLWGLIQDEVNRLSVQRRAYEYNHHYGFSLDGKAIPPLRPADSRSKFLEAFHNLLYLCSEFFRADDDTTVVADGFILLNALKEVHLILTEGAHNQYGDLPSMARQEMLMSSWMLARPEMREFLPTRIMVAYEEPWMDRVDAMKRVQGWSDTSVYHFRNLGVFGEQILLSVRFGAWSTAFDADQGANWARFWRSEIQAYIHSYRAVTGVDLTVEPADSKAAQLRMLPPSFHLRNRLASQVARSGLPPRQVQALVRNK